MKVLKLSALLLGAALFLGLGSTTLSAKCGGDSKKTEKCGAGKCGSDKKAPAAKCGSDKKAPAAKCGDDKKAPAKASKCGSGKCGEK